MKKILVFVLAFLLLSPPFYAKGGEIPFILRVYSFLKMMYIPDIGLLREYWGSKRCWLYNDNYLAYKVLSRHKGYSEIVAEIEENFKIYNVSLTGNGRMEILFDQIIDFPPRIGEIVFLQYKNGYNIFTEISKSPPLDYENYGDLLLYGIISKFKKGDEYYKSLWNKASL
ncbi:MAG: hypothetical protein N2380_08240 [bacterium]|nr:hypothetical protein [bacterium]